MISLEISSPDVEDIQKSTSVEVNEAGLDESCGFDLICMKTRKRISCLQRFATPAWALVGFSILAFMQGVIVNGMINGSLSTLIKRFDLTASEAGFIASSYDVGVCVSLIFVTYIGGQGHKPMWLGWGSVLMGLASIMFAFPHFFAPKIDIQAIDSASCILNSTWHQPSCSKNYELRDYRFLFYVAQFMIGIGASPLYTLGITYLDENVSQVKSSLYHGIYYSFSIFGPGIGYLTAGLFLNIFTDLSSDTPLKSDDSQFIGAWWLGFMIFGILSLIASCFVLLLPKQLPGTDQFRVNREKEMQNEKLSLEVAKEKEFGKNIRDLPRSLLVISRNISFVLITIVGIVDGIITAGLATFLPKVIESLFQISSSTASMIVGVLAIVGGAGGQFLGGLTVTKLKLTVKGIIKLIITSSFIVLLCCLIFYKSCPDIPFAGAHGKGLGNVSQTCNFDCHCSNEIYNPVCGSDKVSYFSPCHAGCKNGLKDSFSNCSCVMDTNRTATNGVCLSESCNQFDKILYFTIILFALFFLLFEAVPATQLTIRVVPFSQRTFAIGIQWLLVRILGTIPGPVLYGYLLDITCRIKAEACDSPGSCKVFRNKEIAINLVTCSCVVKLFGLIISCVLYFVYKATPTSNSENEDQITETVLSNNEDQITEAVLSNNEEKKNYSEAQVQGASNEVFTSENEK